MVSIFFVVMTRIRLLDFNKQSIFSCSIGLFFFFFLSVVHADDVFDTFIDEATRRVFEETIYELDRDRSSSTLHALPSTYAVQEQAVRDQPPLFEKKIHETIQLTFVDEKKPSCTDGLLAIDSLPDVRIEGSQSLAWCSLVTREWLRLFTGFPSHNGPWKS